MCDTCGVLAVADGFFSFVVVVASRVAVVVVAAFTTSSSSLTLLAGRVVLMCRCLGWCPCCVSEEDRSRVRKPPGQWKVSDLDVVLSEPAEGPQADTSESLESSGNTTSH